MKTKSPALCGPEQVVDSIALNNYLLLIGINQYVHHTPLFNAVADCKGIQKILTEKYQFENENIVSLYNEEATRENILTQLHHFRSLGPKDNLLIYFSGHGTYDSDSDSGYWIPVNAKATYDYVSNNDIKDMIKALDVHHLVLIADSCFSGSITRSTEIEINKQAAFKLYKKPSRWALTSGRIELVFDGTPGGFSPFAKTLISELTHNEDDELMLSELGVNTKIITNNNADQSPSCGILRGTGDLGGEFSFFKKDYLPKNLAATPATQTTRIKPLYVESKKLSFYQKFNTRNWKINFLGIGLMALLMLTQDFWLKTYEHWFRKFDPNQNTVFNIALLPFKQEGNADFKYDMTADLEEKLLYEVETHHLNIDVKRYKHLKRPKSIKAARQIGEKQHSNFIIWGKYFTGRDQLNEGEVQYTITKHPSQNIRAFEKLFQGRRSIDMMSGAISDFVEGKLMADINYIIHWAVGCSYFFQEKYDQAKKHFDFLDEIPTTNAYKAFGYKQLGDIYAQEGQHKSALAYHEKAVRFAQENQDELAEFYHVLGLSCFENGQEVKALESLKKAIEIQELQGAQWNQMDRARLYNDFGVVQRSLMEYTQSLQTFEMALQFLAAEENASSTHLDAGIIYNNMAVSHQNLDSLSIALKYYDLGLDHFSKQSLDEKDPRFVTLQNNKATCYYALGNYTKAAEIMEQVKNIGEEVWGTGHFNLAGIYNNLANCYNKSCTFYKAIEYSQLSIQIAIDNNIPDRNLSYAHTTLAKSYANAGEFEKAFLHYLKSRNIRQQIGSPARRIAGLDLLIANTYLKKGDLESATTYADKARKNYGWKAKVNPQKSYETLSQKAQLKLYDFDAQMHLSKQEFDSAIEAAQKALVIKQDLYRPEDKRIAESHQILGEAYLLNGDQEKAKKHIDLANVAFERLYPDENCKCRKELSVLTQQLEAEN